MSLAKKLAGLEVTDPEGRAVALGTLWRERPTVLAFVRHFG
jgi:hypothetical protein